MDSWQNFVLHALGQGNDSAEALVRLKITARFNNMRPLKFKAHPTNAFCVTVNQMFVGSSQLPTCAERELIRSLSTVQTT